MAKGTLSIAGADTLTAADLAADSVGSSEIAAGAVGTSELAASAVTPAKIAYLGDGSGNLSGTITNQQLHLGTAFTLTDYLTINGDVTLGKVRADGTGQSLTQDSSANRTITGTGTLRMGSSMSSVEGMTGTRGSGVTIPAAGVSGVLPIGITGGLGLTSNEPAFSATAGTGTACASGSYTQIAHDTETYDKGGCYNNTASTVTLNGLSVPSYAFLPNVAGTYHITARLFIPDLGNGLAYVPSIYKNGGAFANVWSNQGGVQNICMPVIADLEANGTSDYFQIYIYHNHGSSRTSGTGITYSQFSAFRITG